MCCAFASLGALRERTTGQVQLCVRNFVTPASAAGHRRLKFNTLGQSHIERPLEQLDPAMSAYSYPPHVRQTSTPTRIVIIGSQLLPKATTVDVRFASAASSSAWTTPGFHCRVNDHSIIGCNRAPMAPEPLKH